GRRRGGRGRGGGGARGRGERIGPGLPFWSPRKTKKPPPAAIPAAIPSTVPAASGCTRCQGERSSEQQLSAPAKPQRRTDANKAPITRASATCGAPESSLISQAGDRSGNAADGSVHGRTQARRAR